MIWKNVVGYESLFEISSYGEVRSKRTNKILKQHTRKTGYKEIATKIGGRKGINVCFKVHRLVAEAFIPNYENKPFVNHKDCNKANNKLSNLEWVTEQENSDHAILNGLLRPKYGTNNHFSKLSETDVIFIRQNYRKNGGTMTARELAFILGVAHTQIVKIANNKAYKAGKVFTDTHKSSKLE